MGFRFALALDSDADSMARSKKPGDTVTAGFADGYEIQAVLGQRFEDGDKAWYVCLDVGCVVNGPDHPIPVLTFLCSAPDLATYATDRPTSSVLQHGKRIGRIHHQPEGNRYEALPAPEEIAPGTLVLRPGAYSFEPELIGKVTI
jgi:hypothetical protein